MTEDRKSELARMCRLEIRRTATLIRMGINDGDKEVAEVIDGEFWAMLTRIRAKQITEADLPTLRELVEVSLGLDELDRGESVDIDDVLAKARAIVERHKNDPTQKTAMSVEDDDVAFWLRTDDERGRRQRRVDGSESLKRFLADHPGLGGEVAALGGRERELLDAYAGDLADSALGRVVKEEYVDGYIREEIALWPDVGALSESDRDWLRQWLRRMIDAEYERILIKQASARNND